MTPASDTSMAGQRQLVPPPEPLAASQRSRIFGLVVDSNGAPIAGGFARFHVVEGDWAAGVTAPVIDKLYGAHGLEAPIGADGRFELNASTPTSEWISLTIESDAYHDIGSREFGRAGGRDQPALVSGDNDLGVFTLAATGGIRGKVLDEQSQPIAGAQVRVAGVFPGGRGRQAFSGDDGTYSIGHVPPGKYELEVLRDGYRLAKSPGIDAVAGETISTVEFILQIAATISGVVVDEQGQSIAGARVWGWPQVSGSGVGSGANTDIGGRFTVALKQAVPHQFEISADGFSEYREFFTSDPAKAHAVGATDLRFVLRRPNMTTFVVLDSAGAQPVTRYGVKLESREYTTASGSSTVYGGEDHPVTDHPSGEFVCEARAMSDEFSIRAPGFASTRFKVTHEPGTTRCVVRLMRSARITGRAMFADRPVASAKVDVLEGSPVRNNETLRISTPYDESEYTWKATQERYGAEDPYTFMVRPKSATTDSDGRFTLDGFGPGAHRLVIFCEGARRCVDPIDVIAGGVVDVGEVELIAPSTLRGSVLMPQGLSLAGVKVWSQIYDEWRESITDEAGRFEFGRLPAGWVHFNVAAEPGQLYWGEDFEARLAPGEDRDVELDLRARGTCRVRGEGRINGEPFVDVCVYLRSSTQPAVETRIDYWGGALTGSEWRPAIGRVDAFVCTKNGMPLGQFPAIADLAVGGDVTLHLECVAGRLAFEWPEIPFEERFTKVEFASHGDGAEEKRFPTTISAEGPPVKLDTKFIPPNRGEFAMVAPGDYVWTLRVYSESAAGEVVRRYRKNVTVRANETALCGVTEGDRVSDK